MAIYTDPHLPREVQAVIDAALKYDDERNGIIAVSADTRPDLADAVLAYRRTQLPPMPDRWARVYSDWTANPSWNTERDAIEPGLDKQIAVVRYVAVPESVRWVS